MDETIGERQVKEKVSLESYRVCRHCLEPLNAMDLRTVAHEKCAHAAKLKAQRERYQQQPTYRERMKSKARAYHHQVMKLLGF